MKLVEVWRQFTTLEPEKQGPAVVLTLEGEVQDAILELDTFEITQPDGIDRIITRLNKIYKKDELTQKYNALEAFETYKCKSTTSVRLPRIKTNQQLQSETSSLNLKIFLNTKSYGTNISDDVLANRLLKVANLPTYDKQLVKATITELKYDSVKTKLVKIFSDNTQVPISEFNEMNIKPEPTYHTQSYTDRINYNQTNYENEATA